MAKLRPFHPAEPLPPLNTAALARQPVPPRRTVAMIARGLVVVAGLSLPAIGLRYAGREAPIDGTIVADATKVVGISAPRLRTADRMASISDASSTR
ncbi:hypothetical protein ASF49_10755 [Methylobacterium sp. Leaf104]|uniref:hypothetical protein n=1 Tax=Methylobacterium TaxID=407 RepID=UPI0006FA753F|nr:MULTISPECIES: hypothetical protein [Methylobacterium]KQP31056.1 hypothetical protein ASF49_10755 [Methylobacterium sp. Leaf104]MCI9881135.1 hypothetical protein [Methylobacterium goesingense]